MSGSQIGLFHEVEVARIPTEDQGTIQALRGHLGISRVHLDHLERQVGIALLEFLGEEEADIARTDDDHPLAHPALIAEGRQGPFDMRGLHDHMHVVAGQKLVISTWNEELAVANDADADQMQIGKEVGELAERCIDDRVCWPCTASPTRRTLSSTNGTTDKSTWDLERLSAMACATSTSGEMTTSMGR